MANTAKRVAIITARGGSKRIPRKNIRSFAGQPILLYPIRAALESKLFGEVMVSTDDQEIAEVAKAAGAQVPFLRSAEAANDFATTAQVIEEVLETYAQRGKTFDQFCCLYPTAPFVTAEKLRTAMGLLDSSGAKTVVPVVRFSFPIQRAFQVDGGRLSLIQPQYITTRSQDLPPAYHDSGQFYCGKVREFLADKKLFTDYTLPLILPETEVQDIDNEEDWQIAELKFRLMKKDRS